MLTLKVTDIDLQESQGRAGIQSGSFDDGLFLEENGTVAFFT